VGNIGIQFIVDKAATEEAVRLAWEAVRPSKMALFLSEDAHRTIMERMEKRFEDQGDDASGTWKELSEVSTKFREAAGYGGQGPINVRTGEMKSWLMDVGGETVMIGGGALYTFPGTAPYDTATAEKFKTAQSGKSDPYTVARPVVAMSATDMLEIMGHLHVFITAFGDGSRS
jgi:hypothetical protein